MSITLKENCSVFKFQESKLEVFRNHSNLIKNIFNTQKNVIILTTNGYIDKDNYSFEKTIAEENLWLSEDEEL